MSTQRFTLVCPAVSDEKGNRVRGCGLGWEAEHRTEACRSCGVVGEVRDVVVVQEVSRRA